MFQLHKFEPGTFPVTITINIHVLWENDLGRATKSGYSAAKKKAKRSTWRMRLVGQCILGNWQVRSHVFFPSSHTISNYKYIFRAADLYPIEGGLILLSGFRLPGFGCKICIYMGEYSSSCGVRWQMNKWTDCRVFWYLILVGKCGVWMCGRKCHVFLLSLSPSTSLWEAQKSSFTHLVHRHCQHTWPVSLRLQGGRGVKPTE